MIVLIIPTRGYRQIILVVNCNFLSFANISQRYDTFYVAKPGEVKIVKFAIGIERMANLLRK